MRKSKRLQVVVELAQRKEDECAQALLTITTRHQDARQKLEDLVTYQNEYRARRDEMAAGALGAMALQNYVVFMDKLAEAVSQQWMTVRNIARQEEELKAEWARRYQKRKKLSELVDGYRGQEDLQLEKRITREIEDQLYFRRPR